MFHFVLLCNHQQVFQQKCYALNKVLLVASLRVFVVCDFWINPEQILNYLIELVDIFVNISHCYIKVIQKSLEIKANVNTSLNLRCHFEDTEISAFWLLLSAGRNIGVVLELYLAQKCVPASVACDVDISIRLFQAILAVVVFRISLSYWTAIVRHRYVQELRV